MSHTQELLNINLPTERVANLSDYPHTLDIDSTDKFDNTRFLIADGSGPDAPLYLINGENIRNHIATQLYVEETTQLYVEENKFGFVTFDNTLFIEPNNRSNIKGKTIDLNDYSDYIPESATAIMLWGHIQSVSSRSRFARIEYSIKENPHANLSDFNDYDGWHLLAEVWPGGTGRSTGASNTNTLIVSIPPINKKIYYRIRMEGRGHSKHFSQLGIVGYYAKLKDTADSIPETSEDELPDFSPTPDPLSDTLPETLAFAVFDGMKSGNGDIDDNKIKRRFNINKIEKIGEGKYKITFEEPMPNTDYGVLLTSNNTNIIKELKVDYFTIHIKDFEDEFIDAPHITAQILY
jgi:hypothetical protein